MFQKNLLRGVARAFGLQCSYKNVDGLTVWSPEKTLIKMLEDFTKTKINNDQDLKNILDKKRDSGFEKIISPCLVFWGGVPNKINLSLKKEPAQNVSILIELENGQVSYLEMHLVNFRKTNLGYKAQYKFNSNFEIGYHQLKINIEDKVVSSLLICPPTKLETPNKKTWGPFIPLYALKSESDWGIGSFKEASDVAKKLKTFGGSWMGLLPMLAGNFDHADCDPSPYSSLTRLFWNEIYLDVENLVKKYQHKKAEELISGKCFQENLSKLRATTHVDYYQVYQTKKSVLILLSDFFFEKKLNQEADYKKFETENPQINNYAQFRSDNVREQNFHKFVQFEMNNTLKNFQEENNFGLYMDYPVGVNDAGFDYKQFRSVFFGEVSVGAPPEPVFALGQDWGFPAFHPEGMRNDQYNYFRKSLQHHLKFCKILRLDHIMGLHRIYSVPKKFKGDEGVYLRFPPEELFAVVILEAHRAGADLIGENLGTVPTAVDQIIRERNLNGMWVLQCETWKTPEKSFADVPKNSLACVNTHDMPMLLSYKKGTDLELVESLNILSHDYKLKFSKERKDQMDIWEKYLGKETFVNKVIETIAKSEAKYFVVNLEDLWAEEVPQNIPGTWKEYPNWRKKFKYSSEEWANKAEVIQALTTLKEFRG